MADQWIELLVNAPDRETAEAFALRLREFLPTLQVSMGTGPEVLPDAAPLPRYVVWALVTDVGGTPATRVAAREAVDKALAEIDVTVENGAASQALDMTVVFLA